MKRDLVCMMEIDETSAAATAEFQGTTYYFCAEGCRERFIRAPKQYLAEGRPDPQGADSGSNHSTQVANGCCELARLDMPVCGMRCASCVAQIEKGLCGAPGVHEARVNFRTKRVCILYDPAKVTPKAYTGALRGLGYRADLEKVILSVAGITCARCALHIHQALCGVDGVIIADVNMGIEKVTVEHLAGVSVKALVKAVEGTGCKVLEISRAEAPVEA